MLEIKDELDTVKASGAKFAKRKPNVIVVQLESFMDPSYVKELSFNMNPIPNFTKLKEECSSGFLTMPAIGAGTANSEFEVLSGFDVAYFGAGEYPYKTVLSNIPTISSVRHLSFTHPIGFFSYFSIYSIDTKESKPRRLNTLLRS